jgi:hypothetical protein
MIRRIRGLIFSQWKNGVRGSRPDMVGKWKELANEMRNHQISCAGFIVLCRLVPIALPIKCAFRPTGSDSV